MRPANVVLLSSWLVVIGACVPPRSIAGRVRAEPSSCDGAASAPARGVRAEVQVECPDGNVRLRSTTDDAGRFRLDKAPPIALDCEIVVEGPGLVRRRYLVADHCTSDYPGPIWDSHDGACHNIYLDATVWPVATPSPAGAP